MTDFDEDMLLGNLSRGCHYHLPRSATELVFPSLQQKSQFQFRPSEITPYFVNVKQLNIYWNIVQKTYVKVTLGCTVQHGTELNIFTSSDCGWKTSWCKEFFVEVKLWNQRMRWFHLKHWFWLKAEFVFAIKTLNICSGPSKINGR